MAARRRKSSTREKTLKIRAAESTSLDLCYFELAEADFDRFRAMLDRAPKDNPKLRRLLATKPPWE